MATTGQATENTYISSRAQLMRSRFQHRLKRPLDVVTDRIMPGPNGNNYRADIALEDPRTGLPLVVFEVKQPGKNTDLVTANLKRILETKRYFKLLGGEEPKVVLLVPASEESEGNAIRRAVGTEQVDQEVV